MKPTITFLFPFRWLKEDREFFPQNVRRQIKRSLNGDEGLSQIKHITAYRVIISYQSYMPVTFKLTRTQIQSILKEYLPYAKCIDLEIEYKQHKSRTMLPIFDFQLYF